MNDDAGVSRYINRESLNLSEWNCQNARNEKDKNVGLFWSICRAYYFFEKLIMPDLVAKCPRVSFLYPSADPKSDEECVLPA